MTLFDRLTPETQAKLVEASKNPFDRCTFIKIERELLSLPYEAEAPYYLCLDIQHIIFGNFYQFFKPL